MHLVARIRRPYVVVVALALVLGALAVSRPQPAAAGHCTYCYAPADLRVTNLYAERAWDWPGAYRLWVTIRNDGATTAYNFRLDLGVSNSDSTSRSVTMSQLNPGQEYTMAPVLWRPTGASPHQLWAQIDPANTVYESNEGNNYLSVWFYR